LAAKKNMEEFKLNRLVLLGNGFDLAHNLKTSYNDFILWYLKKSFTKAQTEKQYRDDLIDIHVNDVNGLERFNSIGIDNVSSFVDHFYNEGFSAIIGKSQFKVNGWMNIWTNPFVIKLKSKLVENLILNCSSVNWVDIENVYYEELKAILSHPSKHGKKHDIDVLNTVLKHIIKELEIYLSSIPASKSNAKYEEIIRSPFDFNEFVDKSLFESFHTEIDLTLIVNFNYTSTVEQYFDKENIEDMHIDINYIHGKLNDENNKIILGFGDELDDDYSGFELDKTKGIFEYIKSFWYFKTSNYYKLVRFIESKDFQVYILGHSCGLSDRTMLNMIFEHDNCKSIKIFYHETEDSNNYTSLTQEIARHFKDKQKMRRKIVPFDLCSPMPQGN
jgi:hypothetical protein